MKDPRFEDIRHLLEMNLTYIRHPPSIYASGKYIVTEKKMVHQILNKKSIYLGNLGEVL